MPVESLQDDANVLMDDPLEGFSPVPSPPPEKHFNFMKSSGEAGHIGHVRNNANPSKVSTVNLLDLPVDVLKDILSQLAYTTDLLSLALVHSALHRLVIPQIYTRFDIVWPDPDPAVEPRPTVDALTHGLATLVMGDNAFWRHPPETASQEQNEQPCSHCTCLESHGKDRRTSPILQKTHPVRRGNDYAQFTRRFSLGNGPPDLTQEYIITKESGKMLGTLVAVAVARMHNLESFIWDMPSGILTDIWISLASLSDYEACRLERVWTRWHKSPNSSIYSAAPAGAPWVFTLTNMTGVNLTGFLAGVGALAKRESVIRSTYSKLPPLKSLSVLDIDELTYIEDMSTCIEKSWRKLRELRVGIAKHAEPYEWNRSHASHTICQGDVSPLALHKRRGGVLGNLLGRGRCTEQENAAWPKQRLELEILELERVYLSPLTLMAGLDWTTLTELTILDCPMSDVFWDSACCKIFHATITQLEDPSTQISRHKPMFPEFKLRLKKLFTNTVTKSLLYFLRNTLEANTLETLILQDFFRNPSEVSINEIFTGPVRHHRGSLKKLSIDSSSRGASTEAPAARASYKHWMLNREQVNYLTCGKLPQLRELCVVLNYRDWHTFLQRLPALITLRSLYIPTISGLLQARPAWRWRGREAALQIVDTVALRPEMQLCYVAIGDKCFEIVPGLNPRPDLLFHPADDDDDDDDDDDGDEQDEGNNNHLTGPAPTNATHATQNGVPVDHTGWAEDVSEDNADEDDDDGVGMLHGHEHGHGSTMPTASFAPAAPVAAATDEHHHHHDHEDLDGSEDEGDETDSEAGSLSLKGSGSGARMGLREIVWYDERIDIFKARHGRIRV